MALVGARKSRERAPPREDLSPPEHDDDAGEHDRRPEPIEAIGLPAIDSPAPEEGADEKDASVGGE
jgi:hypothetical protein